MMIYWWAVPLLFTVLAIAFAVVGFSRTSRAYEFFGALFFVIQAVVMWVFCGLLALAIHYLR